MKSLFLTLLIICLNFYTVLSVPFMYDGPIKVNQSANTNKQFGNKYIFLSVFIGIICLFVIGFVALLTTKVQNKKPIQYYTPLSYIS